jgi:hypothetical protein
MLVRAPTDSDDLACTARRPNRALAGPFVTSRNGYYDSCIDGVVETMGKQVIVTMVAAAQGQVENIHAVFDGCVNCI